jgi:hypothetical protein
MISRWVQRSSQTFALSVVQMTTDAMASRGHLAEELASVMIDARGRPLDRGEWQGLRRLGVAEVARPVRCQ